MRRLKVILSIDGGGIRGILPLQVLNYLDTAIRKNNISETINEAISLMAGTSTGAIISSALMLEQNQNYLFSPKDLLNLYENRGPQIFQKDRPNNENPLKLILENNFGSIRMSDLRKCFVFASYDERTKSPFLFTSRMEHYRNVSLSKVLLACSAVPEYFQPVELGGHLLSDGIQTAKNPSLFAYQHAKAYYPNDLFLLLSIGTGKLPLSMYDDIERKTDETHQQLLELSMKEDNLIYYRVQPEIKNANPEMDDTSSENIKALLDDGKIYVANERNYLDAIVNEWKIYA